MRGGGVSICMLDECTEKVRSKGLCSRHYYRARSSGDPRKFAGTQRFHDPLTALENRTVREGNCLIWTGRTDRYGYGVISVNGKSRGAHRVAYIAAHGEPPEGFVIDHLCFRRNCVNPEHLRATTNQKNILRRPGANRNNRTGLRNVYLTASGTYLVMLTANGTRHYGGTFADLESANAAAVALRRKYAN